MTAALAREMGLSVRFRNVFDDQTWGRSAGFYLAIGHVNLSLSASHIEPSVGRYDLDELIIDFLPAADIRKARYWVIDEATVVAMYMNNRAAEMLIGGEVNDAYWWAREAVLYDPRLFSATNTLAMIYRAHGDLAQAQQALEHVLAHEPSNVSALANLVTVLRERGDAVAAGKAAQRLAQVESTAPFAYFEQGLTAMKAHDYSRARELFAREVERAAYYHEFRFWLALAYVGLGDLEQARANLALAVESAPTSGERDLYAAKLERLRAATRVMRH
jgi:Tfp pilus assembly protein PilF